MIFEFKYWRLDIDVESTRNMNIEYPCLTEKIEDSSFLSQKQIDFFDSFGIDIKSAGIEKLEFFDETDAAKSIISYKILFLLKGKFLAIPERTAEFFSDEELFGKAMLNQVEIIQSGEEIPVQTIEDMLIKFIHPCIKFEEYDTWDCGYVLGMAIVKK